MPFATAGELIVRNRRPLVTTTPGATARAALIAMEESDIGFLPVLEGEKLVGVVPLVKIAVSSPAIQLSQLSEPYIACAPDTPQDEVAALFDKYNLITLAVVDEHGRIAGIITADDVITMLRHKD